jgi:hypothetical protein
MKVEALEFLLANDDLFVYSEEVVFNAIAKWIRHDEVMRKQQFSRLMHLVRFEQIKSSVSFFSQIQHTLKVGS